MTTTSSELSQTHLTRPLTTSPRINMQSQSGLPSRVVTQASMASKVTRLNISDVEADGTGRQTMCLSHLLSFCLPRSSVCIPPRRQGQMVTVTVPVLVRPEAPSRSTTGT